MREISIWPLRKIWLSTWWQNPSCQSQRSDVSCSWPPGLHTSQEGFFPTLLAEPLQVIKVLRLAYGNSNLQLLPQSFYGIKVWRLARPPQDRNVLFLSHSFVALALCFGSLSYSNTHPRLFNALTALDAVQLSCSLSRKTPPNHVSTHVWQWGWCSWVIGRIPPPTRRVKLMPKSWTLVSSDNNSFTQFSSELANFRQACTCAFLSREILWVLLDFSRSVLPIVFLVTKLPAALRSLK